jgi:hypothetical protein
MQRISSRRRPGTRAASVGRNQGRNDVQIGGGGDADPGPLPRRHPASRYQFASPSPTLFTSASAGRGPVSLASLSVPRCPMAPRESISRLHARSARKEIAEPIAGTSQAHDLELKRLRGEVPCAECKRYDRGIPLFVIQKSHEHRRLKIKCDRQVPCSSCRVSKAGKFGVRRFLNCGSLFQRRGCGKLCPNGTHDGRDWGIRTQPVFYRSSQHWRGHSASLPRVRARHCLTVTSAQLRGRCRRSPPKAHRKDDGASAPARRRLAQRASAHTRRTAPCLGWRRLSCLRSAWPSRSIVCEGRSRTGRRCRCDGNITHR